MDPSAIELLDLLLQCDEEELQQAFYLNRSIENNTSYKANQSSKYPVNIVHSPADLDVNNLSLNELTEIERKLDNDSPPERRTTDTCDNNYIRNSTDFLSSRSKSCSDPLEFDIDDIICGDAPKGQENVDVNIDSNNRITSYMDCMEPGSSENLAYCDNMMELMGPSESNKPRSFISDESDNTFNLPTNTPDINFISGETDNTFNLPTNNPCYSENIFGFVSDEGVAKQTLTKTGTKRASSDVAFNFDEFLIPNKMPALTAEYVAESSSDSEISGSACNDEGAGIEENDEFEGINDQKELRKLKNNKASRVHRAKKKQSHEELFTKKADLEKRNAELKIQAESIEKEIKFLKELLLVKAAASAPNK